MLEEEAEKVSHDEERKKKVVADRVVLLVMSRGGRAFVASFRSRSHRLDGARRRRTTMERFLFSSSSSSSFSTRDSKKAFSSTTTMTETKEESFGKKKKTREFNSSIPAKVDVAIVGGGLVGVAFARALRMSAKTKHLSVAVLDGNPRAFSKREKKEEEDKQQQQENPYKPKARVSALTPESIDFLERECGGVWTQIEKTNLGNEFDAVQAWDAIGEGYVRFEAKEANRDRLGVVVENDATRNALCDGLIEEFEKGEEMEEEGQERKRRSLFLLPGTSVVGTETTESSPFRVVKYKSSTGNYANGDGEYEEEVKTISARLVVGADGPNGAMKRFAGVRSFGYDYNQKAVCGTVELDGPTKTAFQRFLKNGPIALLPIGNGKSKTSNNIDDSQFPIYANIVWSTTPKEAERITALSDDDFASEVNDAIHGGGEYNYQLRKQQVRDSKIINGGFAKSFSMFVAESFAKDLFSFAVDTLAKNKKMESKVREILQSTLKENEFESPPNIIATAKGSERGAFPLKLKIAGTRTHRRMLLIGDAAHVVHPLGGQGVNLGFKDVAAAIDAVENAISVGDDIGSENTLRNYKNARFLEMSAMVIGLDTLQKIFGPTLSSIAPFTQLRSIGMRAVNSIAPVRESITKFAADGGVLRKK